MIEPAKRVERAGRPGVEQDHGAVADRRGSGRGSSAAIASHGPPRLPSPSRQATSAANVASSQKGRGSPEDARVVVARRERAPEPRPRVHPGRVEMTVSASPHVGASPSSVSSGMRAW